MVRRTGSLLLWGAPSTDAAINPASLGGGASLKLWLDAEDITGLNDGDPVTTWNDSSGNGNHVTQATAAKKPTYRTNVVNGKPVVRFDGVDDVLVRTALNAVSTALSGTMAFVFKMASIASAQDILSSSDEATDLHFFLIQASNVTGNPRVSHLEGTSDLVRTDTVLGTASFNRMTIDSSGTVWRMFLNGTEQTLVIDAGTNSGDWFGDAIGRDNLTIGAYKGVAESEFLFGDVAEVLVYDVQLSDADRATLDTYFATKYGV